MMGIGGGKERSYRCITLYTQPQIAIFCGITVMICVKQECVPNEILSRVVRWVDREKRSNLLTRIRWNVNYKGPVRVGPHHYLF